MITNEDSLLELLEIYMEQNDKQAEVIHQMGDLLRQTLTELHELRTVTGCIDLSDGREKEADNLLKKIEG